MEKIKLSEMFKFENIILSIQHLLAMYAGAVAVPLLIAGAFGFTAEQTAYLVATDIFVCGIATLLQVLRGRFVGIGLPVVMASTFTSVGPMIAIGTNPELGPAYAFGGVLIAGAIMLLIAPIFAKLSKLFPPLVQGVVVALIALTLTPVAIDNVAGGAGSADYGSIDNLLIAGATFLTILLISKFAKGFLQSISILIGIVVGMIVAGLFGSLDFSSVAAASWFQIPVPFKLVTPQFDVGAIISMTIVGIVTFIETTGYYLGVAGMSNIKLKEADFRRGYTSSALAFVFSGIFNTSPQTSFSQNLGVIQTSGVKKREVILNLVALMLLAGLVPKIGAFATAVPAAVLGGALIFLFGNVLAYAISVIGAQDLGGNNGLIVGASLIIGLGVTVAPDAFANLPNWLSWITSSGIVAGTLAILILNLIFNGIEKDEDSDGDMAEAMPVESTTNAE